MSRLAPATAETSSAIKLLVYGPPKSGKTTTALSFAKLGRLAVIDTERGTHPYSGAVAFDRADCATLADALAIVTEVRADGGRTYGALAVDSLTLLWQSLLPAREISQKEWGVLKRHWCVFVNALAQLPIHVVLTAHEHIGDDRQTRPDAEKDIGYWPDLLLHLRGDHSGVVQAVRGLTIAQGTVIRSPSATKVLAERTLKAAAVTA